MEKRDTKKVILDEALELFSTSGYDGVTVADIAEAVGIKSASLYKHYASKQDIFDSILTKAADDFQAMTGQLGIDGIVAPNDVQLYSGMGTDAMIQVGTAFFQYFLHDGTARKLRRLLTIEQYKNPAASELFTDQYIDAPIKYQSVLFKAFMAQGLMEESDADVAAAHFFSPMYFMLCLCDNCPDREPEALDFIRRHIIQFNKLYMLGERK